MPACIIAYLISYVVLHYARFRLRRLPAYGQLHSRRTNKQQQQDPVEHPVLTKLHNPRVYGICLPAWRLDCYVVGAWMYRGRFHLCGCS